MRVPVSDLFRHQWSDLTEEAVDAHRGEMWILAEGLTCRLEDEVDVLGDRVDRPVLVVVLLEEAMNSATRAPSALTMPQSWSSQSKPSAASSCVSCSFTERPSGNMLGS